MSECFDIKLTHRVNEHATKIRKRVPVLHGDCHRIFGCALADAVQAITACHEFTLDVLEAAYHEACDEAALAAGDGDEWPEWLVSKAGKFATLLTEGEPEAAAK